MARIFTIHFSYEDAVHNALVFVKETPFSIEYKLNMLDHNLLKLLPSDKIVSFTPDFLSFYNTAQAGDSVLMNEIIRAISEHIHSLQA